MRGPRSGGSLVLLVIGIDSPPAGVEVAPVSKGGVSSSSSSPVSGMIGVLSVGSVG